MNVRRVFLPGLVAASLAFAGAMPLHADAVSKRAKIEELFKLIQIERTIDQISVQQVAQAKSVMKTMAPNGSVTPDQQKDLDAFLDKVVGITREAVNWQKLEPQFVDLYMNTYSEEEVDGIVAFYRSPAGQVMVAKQPELLSKSQAISQAQLAAIQPKLREAVMEFAQQMAAKSQGGAK